MALHFAQIAPTIIFIDEVDALLGRRKEGDHEVTTAILHPDAQIVVLFWSSFVLFCVSSSDHS